MDGWVNLRSLGAKGDDETDDTKILQDAIDRYPVIYIPQGWYRISATLHLRPATVLIGLNPIATQLRLADHADAFGGFGGPLPLLESPSGGVNIVSGIGLSTGTGNARAVACKWMAGAGSYLGDVKFIGGHGNLAVPTDTHTPSSARPAQSPATSGAPDNHASPRPADQTANWDSQYWSLWITNGGGGTFKDIWTANTDALAGVYISHTATPGRIYALSVEHHVRNEIRLNKVANWKIYALQLEEESRESSECQPMELQDCSDMVFANLYLFRVIRVNKPYPWSIRRWGGDRIELLNVHNYSQTKYTTTSTLYDVDANTEIRPWEFARMYIGDQQPDHRRRAKFPTTFPPPSSAATPSGATPPPQPTIRPTGHRLRIRAERLHRQQGQRLLLRIPSAPYLSLVPRLPQPLADSRLPLGTPVPGLRSKR